ncbi:ABC transporter substrate-binding protein [Streptomyces sp. NBC_00344]|uniref:ABC transporter substrate-binding protein n=1 Tax=Streptomyces sp. NBC_00344 TaxID=2975720 RepID=UPI002E24FD15
MINVRVLAHRIRRLAVTTVAATAGLALLAACGDSSGTAAAGVAAKPGAAAKSPAIPTEDVVSSVVTDPALKAKLPAGVRRSGTLTLGTTFNPGTAGLPHGGETPDGTKVGLDVDLRNAVAKVLGISWRVQNGTFATVIPGVQNGKYDVGQDNFGVTRAREKVVDFATYLNDGQSFLGSKDIKINKVTGLTDLCGLTVATTPGSTFQQILTDGASKCAAAGKKPYRVQYFADAAPIFLGLANGKVDVMFGPTLGLRYDARQVPDTKYLGEISTTPVGFVTARKSPVAGALSAAVNKLIANGDYAKIFRKWQVPGTGIGKSAVNPPPTF